MRRGKNVKENGTDFDVIDKETKINGEFRHNKFDKTTEFFLESNNNTLIFSVFM